jgi:hypothetical protein
MKNAEWCGMGKGAGKRFPEQLRVKAPPRFHEALLRRIGEAVRNGQAADFQLGGDLFLECTYARRDTSFKGKRGDRRRCLWPGS